MKAIGREGLFYKNVRIGPDCWFWVGRKSTKGYGKLSEGNVELRAHRVSYELFVGSVPDGLLVLHSCDNPECCNPNHLSVGTNKENILDKVSKGRFKPIRNQSGHFVGHQKLL